MKKSFRILSLTLMFGAFLLVTPVPETCADPICFEFGGSSPGWRTGYGAVCMGTGDGCRECIVIDPGGGGASWCVEDISNNGCESGGWWLV